MSVCLCLYIRLRPFDLLISCMLLCEECETRVFFFIFMLRNLFIVQMDGRELGESNGMHIIYMNVQMNANSS